eukprot:m.358592 g.358592  ORF g.358592 m.358592 type:complete len:63 (-) comp18190_c0_seq1:884-1072(-)
MSMQQTMKSTKKETTETGTTNSVDNTTQAIHGEYGSHVRASIWTQRFIDVTRAGFKGLRLLR